MTMPDTIHRREPGAAVAIIVTYDQTSVQVIRGSFRAWGLLPRATP